MTSSPLLFLKRVPRGALLMILYLFFQRTRRILGPRGWEPAPCGAPSSLLTVTLPCAGQPPLNSWLAFPGQQERHELITLMIK